MRPRLDSGVQAKSLTGQDLAVAHLALCYSSRCAHCTALDPVNGMEGLARKQFPEEANWKFRQNFGDAQEGVFKIVRD